MTKGGHGKTNQLLIGIHSTTHLCTPLCVCECTSCNNPKSKHSFSARYNNSIVQWESFSGVNYHMLLSWTFPSLEYGKGATHEDFVHLNKFNVHGSVGSCMHLPVAVVVVVAALSPPTPTCILAPNHSAKLVVSVG